MSGGSPRGIRTLDFAVRHPVLGLCEVFGVLKQVVGLRTIGERDSRFYFWRSWDSLTTETTKLHYSSFTVKRPGPSLNASDIVNRVIRFQDESFNALVRHIVESRLTGDNMMKWLKITESRILGVTQWTKIIQLYGGSYKFMWSGGSSVGLNFESLADTLGIVETFEVNDK